ncbi:MAG: hypothetical protein L3K18_09375, partial [Thermoplasmata archaeon]|nr:hypothetical protein [Thermoplasmata archaeon]
LALRDEVAATGPPQLFPPAPISAAYDPSDGLLFVGIDGSNFRNSVNGTGYSVDVVNLATETIIGAISVPGQPADLFYNPVSTHILVSVPGPMASAVVVIDASTESVLREIAVGPSPGPLIYDPIDGDVWVSGSGTLLNATNETAVGTVVPNGGLVFDGRAGEVFGIGVVYSAANGSVVGNYSTDPHSYGIDFDAESGDLYVLSSPTGYKIEPGSLEVVDAANRSVVRSIGLGTPAVAVTWDAPSNEIYVAESPEYHSGAPTGIEIFDPDSFAYQRTILTGATPEAFTQSADGRWLFAVNSGSENVSVLRASTDSVVGSIPREYSLAFAVDGLPAGGAVAVTLPILNASYLVVVGQSLVVRLPNGTVAYTLSGPENDSLTPTEGAVRPLPNYTLAVPASGAIAIDGAGMNYTIALVRNGTDQVLSTNDWVDIAAGSAAVAVVVAIVVTEMRRRRQPPHRPS